MDRPSWDEWFMGMCFWVSRRSPDTSTKHGAVLCDKHHRILGVGYNGFPRGCDDTQLPMTRPLKYLTVIHAETNCLFNSQNLLLGDNYTMYITGFPCSNCFSTMLQFDIRRVVYGPVSSQCINEEQVGLIKDLAEMRSIRLEKYTGFNFQKGWYNYAQEETA